MTNEEASGVLIMLKKRELNALKIRKYPFPQQTLTIAQALDMAIEALSADTVSREVYDAMAKHAKALENLSIEDRVRIMYDSIEDIHNIRIINEVVRCKDCRHGWYDDDIEYYVCRHPKGLNEELYGVDYCSYGQTKEQTEYKLPGHDEVMEALNKLTLRGDKE